MNDLGVSDPVERARRLAAECAARPGDKVLADGSKVHRVERASYILAGWVRTFCGRTCQPSPLYPEAPKCRACERAWKEHRDRLGAEPVGPPT